MELKKKSEHGRFLEIAEEGTETGKEKIHRNWDFSFLAYSTSLYMLSSYSMGCDIVFHCP